MVFESFRSFVEKMAILAVGLSPSDALMISNTLAQIPEPVLESALEDDPTQVSNRDHHLLVMQLMSLDPRPSLRRAVADACTACTDVPWGVTFLLAELAQDNEPEVRVAAERGMAYLLKNSAPMDRTLLLGTWATHQDVQVRLTLLAALTRAPEIVGLRTAVALLHEDPSPEVRIAAVQLSAQNEIPSTTES